MNSKRAARKPNYTRDFEGIWRKDEVRGEVVSSDSPGDHPLAIPLPTPSEDDKKARFLTWTKYQRPFIIVSFKCFTAVRRKLTVYEIHAAIGPLKCCKVFDIFGSVRVPSRLKSSSSHHWPRLSPRRWIRNWGVKFRTSCFGSFVRIYPYAGETRLASSIDSSILLFCIYLFIASRFWFPSPLILARVLFISSDFIDGFLFFLFFLFFLELN